MQQDGFFFDELTDFKKDLLNEIKEVFPEDMKKFLKTEARKLSKIQIAIAKTDVGTSKRYGAKSYHKSFKVGKIFDYYGETSIRAYNKSRHAHLIELGHKTKNNKFVLGRYVMKKSENKFKDEFYKDTDEFLFQHYDNIGN